MLVLCGISLASEILQWCFLEMEIDNFCGISLTLLAKGGISVLPSRSAMM